VWCTWNGAGNSAVLVAAVASAVSSPRGTAWSQAPVMLAASGRRGRPASPAEPSAAFHALPDLASVRAAQIRNSRSPGILRRSPSSMNFAFAPASSAAIWAIALSMSSHSVSVAWLSVQPSGASHRRCRLRFRSDWRRRSTKRRRPAPMRAIGAAARSTSPRLAPRGGESVSQSPLKDKAFSTFLEQNSPFELRPENGIPAGIGRALVIFWA
jgi:hypothetical protein